MKLVSYASGFIVPLILLIISLTILLGKKDYFSSFLSGIKEGAINACQLLPTICALIVSISIFSASGLSDFLLKILSPIFNFLCLPTELFPLIITRPISGGASIATFEEILSKCGVDSYVGLCASLIMASSDTVIYVISVYFSSSNVRKTRYALPCALLVSIISIFISCIVARLFFE